MLNNVANITTETLTAEVARIKFAGYKFVTMSGVELDADHIDVVYHFHQAYDLIHLRLTLPKTTLIPSISGIFEAAFLAENEIQDLFNVSFSNLAIDFKRTLYLENATKIGPFCRCSINEASVKPTSESNQRKDPVRPDRDDAGSEAIIDREQPDTAKMDSGQPP